MLKIIITATALLLPLSAALSAPVAQVTPQPAPSAQADSAAPQIVEIILANFSFGPENIRLRDGEEITLTLTNQGSGAHDFTAPEFFATAQMDAATRKRIDKKGRIEVKKGESVRLTIVPQRGHFKLKCSHFLHAGFGMTGTIEVE